ncbi:MAG: hypothetical protein IKI93_04295 [Clostridia bacterium]|nr:hypothetical protein [Clostridia bacterium]
MKAARITGLILLGISLFFTLSLTLNYIGAVSPAEINDGLTLRGGLPTFLVFGDDGWTLDGFYRAFILSLQISVYLGIANIVLAVIERLKK